MTNYLTLICILKFDIADKQENEYDLMHTFFFFSSESIKFKLKLYLNNLKTFKLPFKLSYCKFCIYTQPVNSKFTTLKTI